MIPTPPASPAPPPGEPARSRWLSIFEGVAASAHGACIGGSLLTAFALALGASDLHIGLIAGLSTAAYAGLLAGAQVSLRIGSRRRVVLPAALAGRCLWMALAGLVFLPLAPNVRIGLFLGVVFAANALTQAAVSPWNDWIAVLVPEERRGRYFGVRNAFCGAAGMLAALAAGKSFDFLRARHPEGFGPFLPFFLGAGLLALAAAALTARMWDPPSAPRPLGRDSLLRPFRHPPFRALMRFHGLWACACAVAGPFFGAHMLRNLHMPMSLIAWYGVVAGTVGLLSHPLWGRITDRYGNRPVLVFNIAAVVSLPLIWLWITPDRIVLLWVDALLTGLCWPGLNLALFNLVLGTAPAEERQSFLAAQGVLVGAAHFAAALAGGGLAEALSGFSVRMGNVQLVNFHVLFVLSSVSRLALLPLAIGLHEPRARPVRALVSGLFDARYRLADMVMAGAEQLVAIVRRRDPDGD